ncbi:MAG: L,D-transpeptidase [Archangium sp.]|nr:L,D-transpeptidase [Archangium sp.]
MTPLLVLAALASTPRIDDYVAACAVPVDGFVVPRGAAAAAAGKVLVVKGGHVEVSHCFFENADVRVVHTVVDGLTSLEVKEGDVVARGQRLGRGAKLSVSVDGLAPAFFVRGRERLVVPGREAVLVVVDVEGHRAVRFEAGAATHEWEVGRGQAEGPKEARGDLRTPRGLYFVVEHTTGPFGGDFAEYFGGAWVKVNYPNAFDAERGVDAGLVTRQQADDISAKWKRRAAVPQRTKLGGGIGFHGWNAPWDGADGGYGLSWGCVVMHPEEVRGFYELVPLGTMVVLL